MQTPVWCLNKRWRYEGLRLNSRARSRIVNVVPDSSIRRIFRTRPSMVEGRVRKILRMLESGTTFTIRDLALEFNLSPSYLQRLFKHQTGVCMGEWINEQRLQRAARLLANSYLSVKEIAHNVGYEHASSFIRAFERRFTQAPARYRKQSDYTKC